MFVLVMFHISFMWLLCAWLVLTTFLLSILV